MRNLSKVARIQTEEWKAYDKYNSTKDIIYLKTIMRCLERRSKLLTSRIKFLKS